MEALLEEVRGLRADLKDTAAAGMRVQALIARVSLQEQRLKALSLQLNEANAQRDAVTRERTGHEEQLKQFDEALASGTLPPHMPREDIENAMAGIKREISLLLARETQLGGHANELAGYVTMEEGRWTDLNSRLDALEQSLQKTR